MFGVFPDIFIQRGVHNEEIPWSPLQLPNLTLWLDASDASTITLDLFSQVTGWADRSGNNHDFIGAGPGTTKPTYALNSINNLNSVQFGAAYCRYSPASDIISAADSYIFVAFKPTGPLTSGTPPYNNSAIVAELETAGSDIGIFIDNSLDTFAYNNDGTDDSVSQVADGGVSSIFTLYHSGGNLDGAIDLDSFSSTPSGNTITIDFSFAIGTSALTGGNAPLNPFDGLVGEVIAGNGPLTATDILNARTYLFNKWKESIPDGAYTDNSGNAYYSNDFKIYIED